jgi:hypothetical protein
LETDCAVRNANLSFDQPTDPDVCFIALTMRTSPRDWTVPVDPRRGDVYIFIGPNHPYPYAGDKPVLRVWIKCMAHIPHEPRLQILRVEYRVRFFQPPQRVQLAPDPGQRAGIAEFVERLWRVERNRTRRRSGRSTGHSIRTTEPRLRERPFHGPRTFVCDGKQRLRDALFRGPLVDAWEPAGSAFHGVWNTHFTVYFDFIGYRGGVRGATYI